MVTLLLVVVTLEEVIAFVIKQFSEILFKEEEVLLPELSKLSWKSLIFQIF